jgi:hypothetical protein
MGGNGAWLILGLPANLSNGNPASIIHSPSMYSFDVEMHVDRQDVMSLGSPYAVSIPGSRSMTFRADLSEFSQIAGATFADCLHMLSRDWQPDDTNTSDGGDGLRVRRRSGF